VIQGSNGYLVYIVLLRAIAPVCKQGSAAGVLSLVTRSPNTRKLLNGFAKTDTWTCHPKGSSNGCYFPAQANDTGRTSSPVWLCCQGSAHAKLEQAPTSPYNGAWMPHAALYAMQVNPCTHIELEQSPPTFVVGTAS